MFFPNAGAKVCLKQKAEEAKGKGGLMEKKPLIIITGPTAAGKTSLSVRLAKALGG